MFKILVKKIRAPSIYYLIVVAVFCSFALALGIISFVYDIVLLGIVLGEGVSIKDIVYGFISIIIPGCLSVVLFRLISEKRKGKGL